MFTNDIYDITKELNELQSQCYIDDYKLTQHTLTIMFEGYTRTTELHKHGTNLLQNLFDIYKQDNLQDLERYDIQDMIEFIVLYRYKNKHNNNEYFIMK